MFGWLKNFIPERTKLKSVFLIAAVVFFLDHITKYMIVRDMALGALYTVIPGYFDIVHTRNTGAAFGMLHDWQHANKDLVFYAIGVFAFFFLGHFIKSTPHKDKLSLSSLSCILGGALGNLLDRFWRGSVVDFLSFHIRDEVVRFTALDTTYQVALYWPAFNVADAAIVCGVTLLMWRSLFPVKD